MIELAEDSQPLQAQNIASLTSGTMINSRIRTAICYAEGKYYCTSSNLNTSSSPLQIDISSDNGVTWSSVSIGTGTMRSICYGNGVLVIVGRQTSTNSDILSSSDGGINWTSRVTSASITTLLLRAVAFGNNTFVAVGANVARYSTDNGVTWNSATITGNYRSIVYTNGLFVAVGENVCSTSTDGITWTSQTIASHNWLGITYFNSQFVAVANSRVAVSLDAITWTDSATSFSLTTPSVPTPIIDPSVNMPNRIDNVNGLLVVVGGSTLWFSNDSINWSFVSLGIFGYGVANNGYNFMCVGSLSSTTSGNTSILGVAL